MPSANIGMAFKLSDDKIKYLVCEPGCGNNRKMEFDILASLAIKSNDVTGREQFIFILSGDYKRFYSRKCRYIFGVDIFYDEWHKYLVHELECEKKWNDIDNFIAGLNIGNEWVLDDVGIFVNIGCYLFKNKKDNSEIIYNKIGITYSVLKNILLQLTLKSYFTKADYLSIGFGYKF